MVLRPHVLQWNGKGPGEGQGDRDILESDPLHDPEADEEVPKMGFFWHFCLRLLF